MTPQEELFASFFNDEGKIVCNMTILELRAHREELAKIAFEARARLTRVDDEERQRKAKAKKERGEATGFETSLQTDELTSDAINKIKGRQARISKQERTIEGLIKMGMERKDAEKLVSAGTILARIKDKSVVQTESDNGAKAEAPKPFVNPFGPKTEEIKPESIAEVSFIEETNTVIITTPEVVPEPTKPTGFINPFAK